MMAYGIIDLEQLWLRLLGGGLVTPYGTKQLPEAMLT